MTHDIETFHKKKFQNKSFTIAISSIYLCQCYLAAVSLQGFLLTRSWYRRSRIRAVFGVRFLKQRNKFKLFLLNE